MSRKRMDEFKKGPKAEEAKTLTRMVFKLKETLGISYDQMVKETGLSKSVLYTLKCEWINGNGKNHKYLYPSTANGLVKFWNSHLVNGPKVSKVKKAKRTESSQPSVQTNTKDILCILIQKVGLVRAKELLQAKGKGAVLEKYLEGLSPSDLVDLI
ncbi:MAG: hypothetical protein A2Y82_04220 [Candidatus Buchananbacteria bacterium RBG_13_36_9]|uniref:Uncharacterized protein n=1 Tax=Candidatus Buchananbacteria bacterium RBG_13_36_9 TaxID=1797530 RepID=A0A1G1XR82_9BACT|nr:MAG: hypothetical protein A2Y82_04220 [Candidatus Buchananbacteria bacterium RBG_13_36_9]